MLYSVVRCYQELPTLLIIVYYYLYSVSYGSNPVGWAYNLVFRKASLIYLKLIVAINVTVLQITLIMVPMVQYVSVLIF